MEITFDDFRRRVSVIYATERYSRGTRLKVRQVLNELERLGPSTTADLTTELMARWVVGKRGANPNTVIGLLGYARSLCSLACSEGWLERPPDWRRLRPRPRAMTRNAPPGFDQLGRLLSHLRDQAETGGWRERRLCALVWTFALTALRLREALYLQVGDVDLVHGLIRVEPRRRLKTEQSAATVPMPSALAVMLGDWVPYTGSQWVFPGVRRVGPWDGGPEGGRPLDELARAARETGLGHITFHALRHAYGTYALEHWGLPLWVVQRVMRHTDARTTARYLHLDGSPAIAAAVRPIGYPRASPA
jgi:integrase